MHIGQIWVIWGLEIINTAIDYNTLNIKKNRHGNVLEYWIEKESMIPKVKQNEKVGAEWGKSFSLRRIQAVNTDGIAEFIQKSSFSKPQSNNSGQDHQWTVKPLNDRVLRNIYSQDLKESFHGLLITKEKWHLSGGDIWQTPSEPSEQI